MSTLKVSTLQNLSGTEVYTCKAWVNFNGTGTVAIRASGNVSSITDNGTADYTVNFTTAMVDANYSVNASVGVVGTGSGGGNPQLFASGGGSLADVAPTTSSFRFAQVSFGGSYADISRICIAVFR